VTTVLETRLRKNSLDAAAARLRCLTFRRRILDLSQNVTAMHIAPAFSCLEIVDLIYFGLMRRGVDGKPTDTFVMSKGHGCMAQYVALEELGTLSPRDMAEYCTKEGRLGGHPDYGNPGIEASTGSLGHGLSMAMGMAYADKITKVDRTVYTVLSDGEWQEGSVWEGMMMAPNLKLDNLVVFLDLNDFQGLGRTSETHPNFYPAVEKAVAFGWETVEVNGHDAEAMFDAVTDRRGGAPMMVICRTVKGKGVRIMEHVPIWHYRSPNAEEYKQAIAELAEVSS
jgi:transketolase